MKVAEIELGAKSVLKREKKVRNTMSFSVLLEAKIRNKLICKKVVLSIHEFKKNRFLVIVNFLKYNLIKRAESNIV